MLGRQFVEIDIIQGVAVKDNKVVGTKQPRRLYDGAAGEKGSVFTRIDDFHTTVGMTEIRFDHFVLVARGEDDTLYVRLHQSVHQIA